MVRPMTNQKQQKPETSNPFGEVENKSLESRQEENKAADESPAAPAAVRVDADVIPVKNPDEDREVEFLHHTEYDGKHLVPGDKATVPARLAVAYVTTSRAKYAN